LRNPFVILLLLLLTASCGELNQQEKQKVNKALNDSLTSTTESWNMDMNIIEGGQKKVRLQGRYAATFNTKKLNETRISGPVLIQVFDSTGAIKTWVQSDSAIYRSKNTEFEFFGDVRVRTRSKRHLQSEYLKWDQTKNKISTPQFVIITTPSDSIAGTGFSGASDLSNYVIKKPTGRVTF
jgi:LPS export ABC transporter protein LptC